MKKFLALLVSVVLLSGLLASFPAAGLDEGGQPLLTENSPVYEGSLDENPEEGTPDEEMPDGEDYANVLRLNKIVVDEDGKPYNGEPDKEFTIHVTGPSDYSETVNIKANHEEILKGLRPGTYSIYEDAEENYTRIDGNTTVTFGKSGDDRFFPDRVNAELGSNWVGEPVLPGRSNPEAALVDEPSDTDIPYQDGNFLSLGYGGVAVFEYDEPFYNGPEEEVGICEITWNFDEYGEQAYVEISQDGTEDSWKYLGWIYGFTDQEDNNGEFFTFDMGNTGLEWARFIRITDKSGQEARIAAAETAADTTVPEASPDNITDTQPKTVLATDTEAMDMISPETVPTADTGVRLEAQPEMTVNTTENTTGDGVEYGDPMDGVDINYVCTRYMNNVKSVDIINRRSTPENPPAGNHPASGSSVPESPIVYYKLTTAVSGQGSILPGPGTTSFAWGFMVQLHPEPAEGWVFDHWQGDTVDNMNRIYIDRDKSVTAVFRNTAEVQPEPAKAAPPEPAPVENAIEETEEEVLPSVEIVEDEILPEALPKTGGIPASIFIGIGGVLMIVGVAGFKKK